jgi:Gamma-glutamyl cyclotransferase, AIG2-like
MRLFLYGTLLGDPKLGASMPATLPGWRRVELRGTRYPTLRRDRRGAVSGAVVDVPSRLLAHLAAYEGPRYRLTRVVADRRRQHCRPCVDCAGRNAPALEGATVLRDKGRNGG